MKHNFDTERMKLYRYRTWCTSQKHVKGSVFFALNPLMEELMCLPNTENYNYKAVR